MTDPAADRVARALQDTMARLAPHWGTEARTWDELGEDVPGQWCQHLLRSAVTELIRDGVIAPVSRDVLAHLAADWDAQAAQMERDYPWNVLAGRHRNKTLRECAEQLRGRLAGDLHPDALDRAARPDGDPGPQVPR